MGIGQVVPGRYNASLVDWGLREVPQLDDAIEAWISFNFLDQSGESQDISFRSLVKTKAGNINKKLMKTLEACGYAHVNVEAETLDLVPFMDQTALNTAVKVDITIVDKPSKDGTKIYKEVEWVNAVGDVGGGVMSKPNAEQSKSLADKLIASGVGKPKPRVRNHAPTGKAGQPPEPDLPF